MAFSPELGYFVTRAMIENVAYVSLWDFHIKYSIIFFTSLYAIIIDSGAKKTIFKIEIEYDS